MSLGAELGWEYSDIDGQTDTVIFGEIQSSFDMSRTRRETHAEVIIRFFF